MKKKSMPPPPPTAPEPQPQRETVPDPERFEDILQDVVESVRRYREYQRQKEEPGLERG